MKCQDMSTTDTVNMQQLKTYSVEFSVIKILQLSAAYVQNFKHTRATTTMIKLTTIKKTEPYLQHYTASN